MIEKICGCGKKIVNPYSQFCSRKCYIKARLKSGWFKSDEMKKSFNTMSYSRSKVFLRKAPSGNEGD